MSIGHQNILENLRYGIYLLDMRGTILYCNTKGLSLLGLKEKHPLPSIEEAGEFYPSGFWKQSLELTDVMVRIGGEQIQFLASTTRIEEGIILCLDPERSQIDDEFRFFVMDNMSEGVVLLDSSGSVLYLNSAAKVMLGVGLHAGSTKQWSIENLGEFLPGDFWKTATYKKEVLFRKGDNEVHLLASTYHQNDKIILCLDEEKRETLRFIRQDSLNTSDLDALVGISPELKKQAMILANSDLSFLITGESGTGKEVTARSIHYSSSRAKGPFVVIDCTALPEHLVESELFGYEPGSFTGAKSDGRAGKFELADGGTIMLDEISELPLAMQPKLLRILNDQLVMRIGSRRPKAVNVRVIACTNRNLKEMVNKWQFREDLYYRLKGAVLNLPPLRERMKHFEELLLLFLKKYGHGKSHRFSPGAQAIMINYRWPGNVRELEKTVQYVLAHDPDEIIKEDLLPEDLIHGEMDFRAGKLKEMVRMHERMLVINALQGNGYNITGTAQKLGLSRMGLTKKMNTLGITHPNSKFVKRFPKRMARGNRAKIEILDASTTVKRGEKLQLKLKVTNTGRSPWLSICKSHRPTSKNTGQYYILLNWVDRKSNTISGYTNTILSKPLNPGESVTIEDYAYSINTPGVYHVLFSIMLQGSNSFLDKPLYNPIYESLKYPYLEIHIK